MTDLKFIITLLLGLLIIAIVVFIFVKYGIPQGYQEEESIPIPPRLFTSSLSYLSGNPVENMDPTLKASCNETFDYIRKYIDSIPPDWAIAAIKYAIQLAGVVGPEISDIMDQLNLRPTRAVILYACDKLKSVVCSSTP